MGYGIALKGSSVQLTGSLAFSVCTDKWMPIGLAFIWTKEYVVITDKCWDSYKYKALNSNKTEI